MGRQHNIDKLIEANPVNRGLDYTFVDQLMSGITLAHFPEFASISNLRHVSHKRRVGKHHSTFIYSYYISGMTKDRTPIQKHLIYSSHSDASRLIAYNNMRRFDAAGFNADHTYMTIVPLEFVPEVKALIYEAAHGKTLYEHMKSHTAAELEPLLKQVAAWIRKFHAFTLPASSFEALPLASSANMNWKVDEFQTEVQRKNAQQGEKLRYFSETFFTLENKVHQNMTPQLIYGDLHPENIITETLHPETLTLIDFTDVARGDQMRDIGTFLQQVQFMGSQFYAQQDTEHLKKFFLEQYFQKPFDSIDQDLLDRINLYQAWSSLRGFVYFFFQPDYLEKSYGLLEDAWRYLYFAGHSMRTLHLNYT